MSGISTQLTGDIGQADSGFSSTVAEVRVAQNEPQSELLHAFRILHDHLLRMEPASRNQRRQEAFLRSLLDCSPGAVILLELGGLHTQAGRSLEATIVGWNLEAERLYGYDAEEIIGRSLTILVPGDSSEQWTGLMARAWQGEEIRDGQFSLRRKDGTAVSICLNLAPFKDGEAGTVCVTIVARESDGGRREEAAVSISPLMHPGTDFSQLLCKAVDAAANGVVITDRAGTILWVNPAFTRMTGYDPEEVIGRKPHVLKSGKHDADFYRQMWQTISAGKVWRGDLCNRRKDGSEYFEEMTITPIRDSNGQVNNFIAIKQDTTEQRKLEENQARLVAVLEATPDFVGMAGADLRPLFLNRAGRRMIGMDEAADIAQLEIGAAHPQWAGRLVLEEAIPTAIRDGSWSGETALLGADGAEIPVLQVIVAHKDGGAKLRFISTIMRDISERKKLEEQVRQAQKMEAIGQLAGGVAHDFNNLLTIISGYSQILLSMLSESDPKTESVKAISEAGQRAAALTRQLLAFSRKTMVELQVLDPNAVMKDTEKMLRRLIGEDIQLTITLDPDVGRVKIDPDQLGQVLMNLAVNARDAMPKGGNLTIQTENVDVPRRTRAHADLEPGHYVMLAMSDTGHGMSPEVKQRIFEPFFTTKGIGKGTGLGLAVVHGIVKQGRGYIEVDSEPGVGTTFRIYLPVADERPRIVDRQRPEKEPGGTEAVLLVEDEDSVRILALLVLQTHGFRVLAARNGVDALRALANHQGPIDILVTDVVMPQMNGGELVKRLKREHPELRVLYTSGYTDDEVVRNGIIQAEVAFLQKPYTPQLLVRKVREVLDQASPKR